MFFVALAVDYDGTIAKDGIVDKATFDALQRAKDSGRKLILVTGRELTDLGNVFGHFDLFDLIVAENGALLLDPATGEDELLAPAPEPELVKALKKRKVEPLEIGKSIVATWEPNEKIVLEVIRDLGLELQIIFNKGAVMVLPGAVNKASGLAAALKRLGISPFNVVGAGDAENDLIFLKTCGFSVATGNALESVKQAVDLVVADHGKGVAELVDHLTNDDLASLRGKNPRLSLTIGSDKTGPVHLSPHDIALVAGSSGGGKSTLVTALIEQMVAQQAQFLVIDPEGDYDELDGAIILGNAEQPPRPEEVFAILDNPKSSVVLNMMAVDYPERPAFIAQVLPELSKLRTETGRPHFLVLDEIQHYLPSRWEFAPKTLPASVPGAIGITLDPKDVAADYVKQVTTMIGIGDAASEVLNTFSGIREMGKIGRIKTPTFGEALVRQNGEAARFIDVRQPEQARKRHRRRYAEGDLADKSFFFRGPEKALKLRARNLTMFLELMEGVDDATWQHHRKSNDYSAWFRDAVRDEAMADEAKAVEDNGKLGAKASRDKIKAIVTHRYVA